MMPDSILQFIERMFVGPVWPASLMVGLMLVYALVVAFGSFDLGMDGGPDLDADADLDADVDLPGDVGGDANIDGGGFSNIGGMTLRWLNLGKIPIVVWLSIFTSFFWAISYAMWYSYDGLNYAPTIVPTVLLTIRNAVLATFITKLITDRLGFLSSRAPSFEAGQLIGKTCQVATSEVSPSFGQAKFNTDAAPLLLNIRVDAGSLPQGTTVEIVAFDAEHRIYKVAPAGREESLVEE